MTIKPLYKRLTWLILLIGIVISGVISYEVKLEIDAHEYHEFAYYCEEVRLNIAARLKAHEQTLLSAAAMFDASNEVTREEWQRYVQRLQLNRHFDGIQGLGFAQWIPAAQLNAHLAKIRAEGQPTYTVFPTGQREFYSLIVFLEPKNERNQRAIGYDMYSETIRRLAMARARDKNEVTLSGRVTLVQETAKDIQPGSLIYAPVYQKNSLLTTIAQRRAALFGWVYSPLRMNDLLNNILLSKQNIQATQIHLQIYDRSYTQNLLYDNLPTQITPQNSPYWAVDLQNNFNNTLWQLHFEKISRTSDYRKVWLSFVSGILISQLLFLLMRSYLNTRLQAHEIAEKLTHQLQESERRFRLVSDSAPVLIWLSDTDKLCNHFNQTWLDFTGRSLAEELGNGWTEGVHPDDFQHCLATYINEFDARQAFQMEYRLRRYDGEFRWLLDTGVPRFADDGIFLGYIGSCIDITGRKQMEQEFKSSEEKFRNTFECAPIGVVNIAADGRYLAVNQTFCDFVGYSREELLQMNIMHLTRKQDREPHKQLLRQLFAGEINQFRLEKCYLHKTHDPVWGSLAVQLSRSMIGLEPYAIATIEDITERKQIQTEILATKNQLQATLNAIPDLLFELDLEGKYLYYHVHRTDLLAAPAEELIGKTIFEVLPLEAAAVCLSALHEAQQQSWSIGQQFQLTLADGLHWFELSVAPKKVDYAQVPRFIVLSRDITERKQMENALKRSEERFRTLFSQAPVGIAIIDSLNGHIYSANAKYAQIVGLAVTEMQTIDWMKITHPDDVQADLNNMALMNAGKTDGFTMEKRYIHANGNIVWVNLTVAKLLFREYANPCHHCIVEDITARKIMENELRESEQKFRLLIEKMPLALGLINAAGKLLYINERFQALFGYFIEEIPTIEDWYLHAYPNESYREHVMSLWTNAVQNAAKNNTDIKPIQYNVTCKNGEVRVISISGIIFGDSILATFSDITERKQMEAKLKDSEARFRSIIDISPVPLALNNDQQQITFLNRAFTQTFGYDLDDIPHLADWWPRAYPDAYYRRWVADTWQAALEKSFKEQQPFTPLELTIYCKNGEQKIVLASATRLEQSANYEHLVVLYDISELKNIQSELFKKQHQLQSIITGTHSGTWEWNIQTGEVIFNERWADIIGYTLAELAPTNIETWINVCHPEDLKRSQALLEQHFAGELEYYDCECRMKHKQGHWVWILDRGKVVSYNEEGKPLWIAGTHTDISGLKHTEAELRIAATIFEAQEGMLITDEKVHIMNVNHAFTMITGYTKAEVIGKNPNILRSDRHNANFYNHLWQEINQKGAWQGEIWNRRKNGEVYPEWLTITAVKNPKDNSVTHYVSTMTDISERKKTEEYIHQLAFYDALTQLPNRRLLSERFKQGAEVSQRTGRQMALFMLDLDRFKAVNDTFGHVMGDQLLQQVALRIKNCLREMDLVARLGGDEFVVLLENINHREAIVQVAEHIIDTLKQPFLLYDIHVASIGTSIGISLYPQHGNNLEILIDRADNALYQAKNQGRGCFVCFEKN